jgi:hypothetical protein
MLRKQAPPALARFALTNALHHNCHKQTGVTSQNVVGLVPELACMVTNSK